MRSSMIVWAIIRNIAPAAELRSTPYEVAMVVQTPSRT
jgi:hypothetical protein